jgi:hypothetical protein
MRSATCRPYGLDGVRRREEGRDCGAQSAPTRGRGAVTVPRPRPAIPLAPRAPHRGRRAAGRAQPPGLNEEGLQQRERLARAAGAGAGEHGCAGDQGLAEAGGGRGGAGRGSGALFGAEHAATGRCSAGPALLPRCAAPDRCPAASLLQPPPRRRPRTWPRPRRRRCASPRFACSWAGPPTAPAAAARPARRAAPQRRAQS